MALLAKWALLVGVVSVFVPATVSQSANAAAVDNVYAAALQASILQMEKEWGHQNNHVVEEIPTDYRHMIVLKYPAITDKLPTNFDDYSVEYLDHKALIERYRKLNKSFEILEIFPMVNEGPVLRIAINASWVSYKKRRLFFGVSEQSNVEARYNCEKGAFVIESVKLGGI